MGLASFVKKRLVSPEIEERIEEIPKPTGTYGYDPWGYSTEGVKVAMGLLKPLYDKYFRVEAFGLENVPQEGPLLIIANHSGQLPLDAGMIAVAVATNPHGPRAARAMAERWFPTVPYLGNAINMAGAVIGDPVNCVKMLRNGEAVIVFPEGARGAGKPFEKRYQLQRFGTGFMHLAINEQIPILPVGVVGCEETMPSFGNFKLLADLLKVPYFPISPWVPLPAKVVLSFGKPMRFGDNVQTERDVENNVDQVKDAIRDLIDEGLAQRKGVFR